MPVLPVRIDPKAFSKRLENALRLRDMSQSDLARIVWKGETRKDSRNYDTVVGRDRISSYIRGRSVPEPRTLQKIAEALRVPVEDLAPEVSTAHVVQQEHPELQITMPRPQSKTVLLRVNKMVPFTLANKIAEMLMAYDNQRVRK